MAFRFQYLDQYENTKHIYCTDRNSLSSVRTDRYYKMLTTITKAAFAHCTYINIKSSPYLSTKI